MSLYGNRDIANNAPKWEVLTGVGGSNANGVLVYSNTYANAVFVNSTPFNENSALKTMAVGVFGVQANTEKLRFANVAANGVGYSVGDPIAVSVWTGASAYPGTVNASLYVATVGVTYANAYGAIGATQRGTGYANGDLVTIVGNGTRAVINITSVANLSVGNVSTIEILSNGSYTANFWTQNAGGGPWVAHLGTANTTGIGTGLVVNVGISVATFGVANSGDFQTRPTATTLKATTGTGAGATANLSFYSEANTIGGVGWVLRKVRPDGRVFREILVAARSLWGGNGTDKGVI